MVEELATTSIYHNNGPYSKGVSAITFYMLYQAKITPLAENSETKVYYGVCKTPFKLRYAVHKKLFNRRNRKSDTELSNKFWRIKDKHNPKITMGDFR